MITLTKDQVLFMDNEWAVLTGGDYEPDALVECYRIIDPSQKCANYATLISTGEYPQ